MSKEAMKLALEAAYLAGFNASGEGYNGEYPFGDHARNPEEDAAWIKDRDNALREALAEQPAQQEPVAMWDGKYQIEFGDLSAYKHGEHSWTPLYTSPQPAQRTPAEVLDWLADQHRAQCGEDRPIQEWIRKMKGMLP